MAAVNVLCAGAVKAALQGPAGEFERGRPGSLRCAYGPVGSLRARLEAGEPADLLILSRPVLDALAGEGRVEPGSIADIGTVGVGIAVRRGAPLPDIASAQALRARLLEAESVCYGDPAHGDSSGTHFAKVLQMLGLAEAVAGKAVLAAAGLEVVEIVGGGRAALGATQSSVIAADPSVVLAGLLPPPLQHTTTYALALAPSAGPWAREFAARLRQADAAAHFRRAGFAPA